MVKNHEKCRSILKKAALKTLIYDWILFMYMTALLMTGIITVLAVLPLKKPWYIKTALAVLILIISMKMMILRLIGGPLFFAPDLPVWLLRSTAFVYCSEFIFLVLLLLLLPIRAVWLLTHRIIRSQAPDLIGKYGNQINLALLILSFAAAALGMSNAAAQPAVKPVQINSSQLPAAADGLRIAVLADLHIDAETDQDWLSELLERTNALKADIIIIVGDMVDGTVTDRRETAALLKKLHAPLGVYAVSGNHDCYSGYWEWMDFFAGHGLIMLENRHIRLDNGIVLAGISDPAAKKNGNNPPDLKAALSGVKGSDFTILLAHRPGWAIEASQSGVVDLQISGHTHGGMVRGFDLLVGYFNENFISGLYRTGAMDLYVSNGSAIWNGFPLRLGRASEITLITLSAVTQGK